MRKRYFIHVMLCFVMLFFGVAQAKSASPVGLWKTFDDTSGKPSSLVRISEKNGELSAVIVKDLLPSAENDMVCDKCQGNLKDKPIIGLPIMESMKQNGEYYEGGTILDPDNGEIYHCKLKLDASGNKLEVRGFVGVSLIGRTQIWMREQ